MNYIPKHSRGHADLEYVSHVGQTVSLPVTNKHTDTQLYILVQIFIHQTALETIRVEGQSMTKQPLSRWSPVRAASGRPPTETFASLWRLNVTNCLFRVRRYERIHKAIMSLKLPPPFRLLPGVDAQNLIVWYLFRIPSIQKI